MSLRLSTKLGWGSGGGGARRAGGGGQVVRLEASRARVLEEEGHTRPRCLFRVGSAEHSRQKKFSSFRQGSFVK